MYTTGPTSSRTARRDSARSGPYLVGGGLGFDWGSVIGAVVGTAVGGPGSGTAAGAAVGGKILGGNDDEKRKNRVAAILSPALQGSPTAIDIIIAAPDNVAGHEDPYWIAARAQIPPDLLNQRLAATGGRGWWPEGADFDMTAARQQIARELAQLGVSAPSSPFAPTSAYPSGIYPIAPMGGGAITPTTPRPQYLPGMTTTAAAPSWLLPAAAAGVALLLILSKR